MIASNPSRVVWRARLRWGDEVGSMFRMDLNGQPYLPILFSTIMRMQIRENNLMDFV
jgi:hypothetical protein